MKLSLTDNKKYAAELEFPSTMQVKTTDSFFMTILPLCASIIPTNKQSVWHFFNKSSCSFLCSHSYVHCS